MFQSLCAIAPSHTQRRLSHLLIAASFTCSLLIGLALTVKAQAPRRTVTLLADVQEANTKTGVVTARGNVRINYPARQMEATAAQAQYFTKERRIILSGNVFIVQAGNTMKAETATYLIDEGRFIAIPDAPEQVRSTYLVDDPDATTSSDTPAQAPPAFNPKPAFKSPISGATTQP